ncbi:chemotaxis-specific protein-glutamate methyltransferase CheB [Massilia sp. PWRC2]|uniref:chemotaxis-specific protein-glutamate methyltransferase CheB n=1 Tax=Massilia sp. PWRC2 TaxID=2804626 RepID=UPI003CF0EC8B
MRAGAKIKLLIVDDSALMRRQLASLFEDLPDFVVRLARNGVEAVAENRRFEPDVITLDINMPELDGLTALAMIMAERQVAVVMISSLTEKGALITFEALNLGAVDFVAKPGGTISLSIDSVRATIIEKVRTAARARLRAPRAGVATLSALPQVSTARAPATLKPAMVAREGVVVVGVSTGGPSTLEQILPLLPARLPWPVLVAQHMPASFTASFAQRLDGLCPLRVVEANRPMPLEAGTVYIGKGGADMVLVRRASRLTLIAKPENTEHMWHPSAELLGRSALEQLEPANLIGVMLTGMGSDGAAAFTEIRRRGGRTIAESEASAVVFGMPAELIKRDGATVILPADKIAAQVNAWLGC